MTNIPSNSNVPPSSGVKYPCGVCGKSVAKNHRAIQCDLCDYWIHIKCNKFDKKDYDYFQKNEIETFHCLNCKSKYIPFSTLDNNQFDIAVNRGINYVHDSNLRVDPSFSSQQIIDRILEI